MLKMKRDIGRRKEDLLVRKKAQQYAKLFDVAQTITSEMDVEVLFEVIVEQTNHMMNTARSTVFLHDEKSDELFSLVGTGIEKNEIRIKTGSGLAGWVFHTKIPLIINDAYNDSRFHFEIDEKTGFKTKNILSIPIVNRASKCVGVLQGLNKKSGDFLGEDILLLESISLCVAIAVENSRVYSKLKNATRELSEKLSSVEALEKKK